MSDQESLEFEGEQFYAAQLSAKGNVPMGVRRKMHRRETFGVVAKGRVADVAFKDVKDVATRVHTADLEDAVIVDLQAIEDIIEEERERITGQMRLLSFEGETRRAGRLFVAERERAAGDEGFDDAHDDAEHTLRSLASLVKAWVETADAIDPDTFEGPTALEDYWEATQERLVYAGGLLVATMTYTRRRQDEAIRDRVAKEEEAERERALAEARAKVEHSDEEADKRERRGIDVDGETGEVTVAEEKPAKPKRRAKKDAEPQEAAPMVDPHAEPTAEGDAATDAGVALPPTPEDEDPYAGFDDAPLVSQEVRVELSGLIGRLEDGAGGEYVKWCYSEGIPTTLSKLTVPMADRARAKLNELLGATV